MNIVQQLQYRSVERLSTCWAGARSSTSCRAPSRPLTARPAPEFTSAAVRIVQL